jgi:hypothetical protein
MRASVHVLGLAALFAGYALLSCITHEIPSSNGSGGDDDDDDDGGETLADLPACPYTMDITGGTAQVTYGRVYLDCDVGTAEEACLSNDPTTCPDHGSSVNGGTTISCSNQCEDDQYAISVDLSLQSDVDAGDGGLSVVQPTSPNIPASCELASQNPGGGAVYCCDCPDTN